MQRKSIFMVLSLIVLAGGVIFFAAATSQAVSAASLAQTSGTVLATTLRSDGPGGRGCGGVSDQELATALGITVDELNTATQKAGEEALKQAVTKGLITQAQADELNANGSAFPFGNRWEGWLSENGIDYNALLANALGITVEKLQSAYDAAFTAKIDQAVTDGNLTQAEADLMKGQYALQGNATFQSTMKSAYETALKQAVTDGVITQAQADQILTNSAGMNPGGFMMGPGGRHGMGGFDGRPEGFEGRGHRGGEMPMGPFTPEATTTP
jgi:hypothetical protein